MFKFLYQKIAFRVWVLMQQTMRAFEFSSPSYARFTKMCLAGREAFDMSNWAFRHIEMPLGRIIFLIFGQRGIGHVEWGNWTC